MPSTTEAVLDALHTQIKTYFDTWGGVPVLVADRETALPEILPATGGLVIVRDGTPGEAEGTLGNMGPYYYSHETTVEIYAENVDAATRNATWSAVARGVGIAIDQDHTLGGTAFGLQFSHPEASTTPVEGGEDIKMGELRLTIDYETLTRIA